MQNFATVCCCNPCSFKNDNNNSSSSECLLSLQSTIILYDCIAISISYRVATEAEPSGRYRVAIRPRSSCVVSLRRRPRGQVDSNCAGAAEEPAIVVSLLDLSGLFQNLPCKESDPSAPCPLFTAPRAVCSSNTAAGLLASFANIRIQTLRKQVGLLLSSRKGKECKSSVLPFLFVLPFVLHQHTFVMVPRSPFLS